MSFVARLLIAIFAALCGLVMIVSAPQAGPGKSWPTYLFSAFCLSIALVCFLRGRLAHFFGGLIATGVLGAGLAYLASMLTGGPLATGRQSDTSVINSILFLVVFGVPAAKYLLATRFGFVEPPRPLSESLFVDFDEVQVRLRTPDGREAPWNQQFHWSDITRVCFRDEGLDQSDLLFIEVRDRKEPIIIPTEASGGTAFFGALTERGLFPETVWRKAMGETGGGIHCWPPHDAPSRH